MSTSTPTNSRKASLSRSGTTRLPGSSGKKKKLELKLVPETESLKEKLKSLGANPFVQISFKPSKTLSFIFDYILTRRYGALIAAENRRDAHICFRFDNSEWVRGRDDAMTMEQLFATVQNPANLRLRYFFDANILMDPQPETRDVAAQFESKTKTTKTIFDASNSFFLSGFSNGGDSLQNAFLSDVVLDPEPAPLFGAPLPPQKLGPLAQQFNLESEHSFSSAFQGNHANSNSLFGLSKQANNDHSNSLFGLSRPTNNDNFNTNNNANNNNANVATSSVGKNSSNSIFGDGFGSNNSSSRKPISFE